MIHFRLINTMIIGFLCMFSAASAQAIVVSQQIAAGIEHTVALKTDGTVVAWGSNDFGQSTVPVGLTGITAIAAGRWHTVALKSDGTVVTWGDNTVFDQTTVPAGLTGVVSIAAGNYYTVALKSNGTVVAWGGQLVNNVLVPVTVPVDLTGVTAIAATNKRAVALKSDGTVVAWGSNNIGSVPAGLTGVTAIAAGADFILALKSDGTMVAWGTMSSVPVSFTGITAISAGGSHAVALKSNGTVVAWGGNGFSGQNIVPPGLTFVIAVAAGSSHSVALKSDGTVVAWGLNGSGQTTVPAGLNLGGLPIPQIGLSLNSISHSPYSYMILSRIMMNSSPATNADIYIALQLPDSTLLVLQPDGSFSTAITPKQANVSVPTANDTPFTYQFSFAGTEPAGTYTWFAALMQPGTLNVIGTMASQPFTFTP